MASNTEYSKIRLVQRYGLLHNPWLVESQEFLDRFVLRHDVLAELVQWLRLKPATREETPHLLVTGGRGMGKTTLLRRLAMFIEADPQLSKEWLPLTFSEEQYGVGDVADWLAGILRSVARVERDSDIANLSLSDNHYKEEGSRKNLAEALFRRLVAFGAKTGRRLLLLCDNFDMLLGQLTRTEQRLLCRLLRNDGQVQLLGAALVVTREAERTSPVLRLFRIQPLAPLSIDEHLHLLAQLAIWGDGDARSTNVRDHADRALRFYSLTGGNPRITTILHRVLSSTVTEALDLRRDLELLLDELTPLYKAQIDHLAPQQRRLCDALARSWQPLSVTELSSALRLSANTVTSLLGRLRAQGHVTASSDSTKDRSRYCLGERLFNIYWLMRCSGEAQCNLRWLSLFLQSLFQQEQLGQAVQHIRGTMNASDVQTKAVAPPSLQLECVRSLASALIDPEERLTTLIDALTIAERVPAVDRASSVSTILDELLSAIKLPVGRGVKLEELRSGLERFVAASPAQTHAWLLLANVHVALGELVSAEAAVQTALALAPSWAAAHLLMAKILDRNGRMLEARRAAEESTRCDPSSADAWAMLGHVYVFCPDRRSLDPSVAALRRAAELDPATGSRWRVLSAYLYESGRLDEAVRAAKRAVQVDTQNPLNWAALAVLFFISSVQSKYSHLQEAAGASLSDPWLLVRALYYRLFDFVGQQRESGGDVTSARMVAEQPWRHWAAFYVPRWLLSEVEELLAQELVDDPKDVQLRWSLALVLGRQKNWHGSFRNAHRALLDATPEILVLCHPILFGYFLFVAVSGYAAEAKQLLAGCPALLAAWPALHAALDCRATGASGMMDALNQRDHSAAQLLLRCMEQVCAMEQHPI